jgi:hypothetical protein
MPVLPRATWHHISEDGIIHSTLLLEKLCNKKKTWGNLYLLKYFELYLADHITNYPIMGISVMFSEKNKNYDRKKTPCYS